MLGPNINATVTGRAAGPTTMTHDTMHRKVCHPYPNPSSSHNCRLLVTDLRGGIDCNLVFKWEYLSDDERKIRRLDPTRVSIYFSFGSTQLGDIHEKT